ncbi:MAG: asparagine synthase-related protein [Myxococcota bacterium]|nr:asparagine synthase-related protein [Myxococcota bacterium]
MAGIAGGIYFAGERPRGEIRRLSNALAHRGEQASFWSAGPVAMVQRSQSGFAPAEMDGKTLVLDGRIHGIQELRQRLIRAGQETEGLRESELILRAWLYWGADFLAELEGDFAIAIWESDPATLWLFRDRFGAKPLFYAREGTQFAFASDPRALLRLDWLGRDFAYEELAEYLSFRYTHAPRTLLRGVSQLPPGHWARVDSRSVRLNRWNLPVYCPENTALPEEGEAVWQLESALSRAVGRRAEHGERVGILLSGGSASSAIAAMTARNQLPNPRSYYLALADAHVDEQAFASRAATLFGTEHRAVRIEAEHFFGALDTVTASVGQPLTSPAAVCEYLLCQRASREVDVLLTGTGADELLAGTAATRLARELSKARLLSRTPERARRAVERASRILGFSKADEADSPGLARLIGGSNAFDVNARMAVLRDPGQVRSGMRRTMLEPFYNEVETDPINEVLHVYARGWMAEDTLQRADGVGAITGLDVRFPMLDTELVKLCANWPGAAKVKRHGGRFFGRWPLRQLVSRHLPSQLVWRPDRRMPAPLHDWLRGPWEGVLRERVESLCDDPLGLFRADAIRKMADEHSRGEVNHGLKLWTLFFFDSWWRQLS